MTRREAIKSAALGASGTMILPLTYSNSAIETPLKGNIKHTVCGWCYPSLSFEELCQVANSIGLVGIDLVGPEGWSVLKKYNLVSSMCNGAEISLTEGFNNKVFHATLIENYLRHIDLVSQAGFTNLICFSGNRNGIDDETGLKNATIGLKKILSYAEKKGVVIQMELFNSKVDHPDYMCDNSAWGIELCQRLDSPNFKLLYDIYHMQISEGDIIRTIQENHSYFGHYHTAGVPGRHEIDETQELFYPAIMQAIHKTGYEGFVAQEFIPTNENPIVSLKRAISICDI
jgi:hydroxypyruvate isomerase